MKKVFLKYDLIYELVIRDLKLRYSRPVLGFLWTFLIPFLMAGILYLIFSVFLKIDTKETPFFLYLMTAVFSWKFFQDSLICSVTSLLDNKNIIKETNFPHYLIPVSIVLANFITFLPSLVILIATSSIVLKGVPVFIVFLPFILLIHLMITMGFSMILSILYVKWRDTKYILEIALTLLFYLTPVFYSVLLARDSLPKVLFNIYIYNPLVGILSLYRIMTLKGFGEFALEYTEGWLFLFTPFAFSVLILLFGIFCYKRNKHWINDHISY